MSSLTYDLTLAGLSVGTAAALTGVGLIVTYRATGVLNFAHGAIAMVCAYVLRQCVVEWGWPLWAGAVVTLLILAPVMGVVLERFVFRPLSVLGGDPAQTLVASIGVFVLLVGGAALLWGQGARDDAPELVSADPWGQLAVVLVLAAGVGAVIRWTRFGRELRAVVDDRGLAVLGGIDADRVAAAALGVRGVHGGPDGRSAGPLRPPGPVRAAPARHGGGGGRGGRADAQPAGGRGGGAGHRGGPEPADPTAPLGPGRTVAPGGGGEPVRRGPPGRVPGTPRIGTRDVLPGRPPRACRRLRAHGSSR